MAGALDVITSGLLPGNWYIYIYSFLLMSGLLPPLPCVHLAAEFRSLALYIRLSCLLHLALFQWTGIFLAHSFIPLGLRLSLSFNAPGVWCYTDFHLSVVPRRRQTSARRWFFFYSVHSNSHSLQDAMTYHRREAKRTPIAASGTYLVLAGL